jgi:diacylglycerol kinase family enzyme
VTALEVTLLVVAVAAAALAALLAVALLRTRGQRRLRHQDTRLPFAEDVELRPRIAVVVNPTKVEDLAVTQQVVAAICTEAGWATPTWYETTADDPGEGQTRAAVRAGADVVCAFGGDGTVRVVGSTLAGTGVPLGVIPAGTGNLLARNLSLPLDLHSAVRVALSGRDMPIDVGRCSLDVTGEDEQPRELAFLVMAGLGFDAAIMADVQDAMKERIGYLAYVAAGARNLRGPQMRVRLSFDGEPPIARRVRTVLAGNVGRIGGGINLMPAAEADDGYLDTLTLSPHGVVGWTAVAGRVITRRRSGHERVEHRRCRRLRITTDDPEPVQVDGDVVAEVRAMDIRLDRLALVVRAPEPAQALPPPADLPVEEGQAA